MLQWGPATDIAPRTLNRNRQHNRVGSTRDQRILYLDLQLTHSHHYAIWPLGVPQDAFDLQNAGQNFQRRMDMIMAGLPYAIL